ncbi:MAG: helix-turn-helix transcriptional regulator [Burkholderiaceae bacterium]|nr:helix-turn-helix transcriptional regulator [Burkholderiaceae bacterium]MDH3459788.1 helix-turn-helix transcriptional regulator [Burkholderiaceae bacterium]
MSNSTYTLARIFAPAPESNPDTSFRAGYGGPERRSASSLMGAWLAATLDEIDYGVLLLRDTVTVAHANHSARAELTADHPLQLVGNSLRTRDAKDAAPLREAVTAASGRGLRRMLTMGQADQQVTVAVVPLIGAALEQHPAALVLSKRQACGELSVQGFARCHGLTQAETSVLQALSGGVDPAEIAQRHGVAVCTVRSQIGSLRAKTGAASIRDLLSRVAALPPLVPALGRHFEQH